MVSEAAARDGYDGVVGIVTHMGDVPVDDGWPPNGCAKCGQPERGHPGGDYAYVPPSDALRLARMRARRDARLNPPTRPAPPPDTVLTLTADTDDFADALRYVAASAETAGRAMEALSDRLRGAVAERMRETRVIAVGAPGTDTESAYRTQRCRCSLCPAVPGAGPEVERIDWSRLRTSADFLVEARDEDWPEQGSTCAHVCGPDPGHRCDAKAVTSLRHPLPSGGMRNLPLCAPCAAAEDAATGHEPPTDFAAALHRLRTSPGVTRTEVEQAATGILALADQPDAGTGASY